MLMKLADVTSYSPPVWMGCPGLLTWIVGVVPARSLWGIVTFISVVIFYTRATDCGPFVAFYIAFVVAKARFR